MMTRQEIFDKAYLGLKSQKFVQSVAGGTCSYRGNENTKCAFGHLIPDDLYDPGIEGLVSSDFDALEFYERWPELWKWYRNNFSHSDRPFIRELQKIHDSGDGENMQAHFESIAKTYDLTIPE